MSTDEEEIDPQGREHQRANDFRYIPADGVLIGVNDNGVMLRFSVDDGPGKAIDLVQVHLSHQLAKKLGDGIENAFTSHRQRSSEKLST